MLIVLLNAIVINYKNKPYLALYMFSKLHLKQVIKNKQSYY